MKSSSVEKTLSNCFAPLVAAMVLSIGAAGIAHAASCQNKLEQEISWLYNTPSGYVRNVGLVMVSNSAASNKSNSMPLPEVTYLSETLSTTNMNFFGVDEALFNNRQWSMTEGLSPELYPFDPQNTEYWAIWLSPANNSMYLKKGPTQEFTMPLDCDGNLMVATYTKYIAIGNALTPLSKTKYVLSLFRTEFEKAR